MPDDALRTDHSSVRLTELSPEQQRIVSDWNDTAVEHAYDQCVHRLFEAQVDRTPSAVAVVSGSGTLTYARLNERANQLAWFLAEMGVGCESRVGILMERSLEMVVAVVGALKAGAAYVPLDPAYPPRRLTYMLRDAGATVLLTQEKLATDEMRQHAAVVSLDRSTNAFDHRDRSNLAATASPQNLAYVIYTSGSTGAPKGVMIEHRSLSNHLLWMQSAFPLTQEDAMPQKYSLSFDVATLEICAPLLAGARLVMTRPGRFLDSRYLSQLIVDGEVSVIDVTPSLLQLLLEDGSLRSAKRLRRVTCGGEAMSAELRDLFFAVSKAELANLYGPTETTISSTFSVCERDDVSKTVPIGRPIDNTQVYILDDDMSPVPIGATGELFIGGVGLARGYLNEPELTEEKFVPNPFCSEPGSRLFKSGDLGRYRADGSIEFLGRIDEQVKIRGYRIELGEIEAALRTHESVQEAVVSALDGPTGAKRLIGYVTPRNSQAQASSGGVAPTPDAGAPLELWPSVGEYQVYDGLLYYAMTHDEVRNQSYRAAIDRTVKDKTVVDVGTGKDLLLARFCAEAGARRVYAIETIKTAYDQAAALCAQLGLDDRITLIHSDAQSAQLPEKVDVCVSELIGMISSSEGVVPLLNNARRFLKDDGVMIPWKSITKVAAVTLPNDVYAHPRFDEVTRHYVDKAFASVGHPFDIRLCIKDFPLANVVSEEATFEELDFSRRLEAEYSRSISLTFSRDCRWDGFLLWLNLHTADGEIVDSLYHRTHWLPVYFPVSPEQIEVSKHDTLEAVCTVRLSADKLRPDYEIRGELVRRSGERQPFFSESLHHPDMYKGTSFYQRLFSNESVRPAQTVLSKKQLRSHVQQHVPSYMVPDDFLVLDRLPLTPSGKVDRRSLPMPRRDAAAAEKALPGRTPFEEIVAKTWEDVLGVNPVGVFDDFFSLGGNSLLATQIVARIRNAMEVDIDIGEVFDFPAVGELAKLVENRHLGDDSPSLRPIRRASRSDSLPLSFAQERVWFLGELIPESVAYNAYATVHFTGKLNVSALEEALSEIVRRHEILRTSFHNTNGTPTQRVHQPHQVRLPIIDLTGVAGNQRAEQARQLIVAECKKPFDVTRAPLIRWVLLKLTSDEHVLVQVEHHFLHDGWSMSILMRELGELYRAYSTGATPNLPKPLFQFADYAVWQREWMESEAAERQLTFWKEQLAGMPTSLQLPSDYPRRSVPRFQGKLVKNVIPAQLCKSVEDFSRQEGVTLFMTLLATFKVLLRRYASQQDIAVGSGVANRRLYESENLIGMVLNNVVLRSQVTDDVSFRDFLAQVSKTTLSAYAHQDLPFERVVEAVAPTRDKSYNPLFQVSFSFHDSRMPALDFDGLTGTIDYPHNETAKFDLNVIVEPRAEKRLRTADEAAIVVDWEYDVDLFRHTTIERMADHYLELLNQVLSNPDARLHELSMLSDSERRQLLDVWSGSSTDYARESSIPEQFEQEVARDPDAVALLVSGEPASYGDLNASSNQLARHLRDLGVGPEVMVGICARRSVEMVVGILGILKAGGAYVPLDPDYPGQRLAFMIEDTQAPVLLTQSDLLDTLPEYAGQVICLDRDWPEIAGHSRENLSHVAGPENLAYVIYTSGSTGVPKGTSIVHRSVVRLVKDTDYVQLGPDETMLQFAPISFDASTFELWGSLLNGGKLVVFPPHTPSLEELGATIREQGITTLFLTSALFHQMVDHQLEGLRGVRQLFTGGDVLSVSHVKKVLASLREGHRLINVYGPTENTTFTSYHVMEAGTQIPRSVPIGRPIANTRVYILDDHRQPVPIGVPGELYIGGDGLAREYLHRPDLTREKFVDDPFRTEAGARLYRTGDQCRWLADGTIEFLGRRDQQVKVRGFRVELGEIEAALLQHPAVSEAAVVMREDDAGDKRLVAYMVVGGESTASELQAFLKQRLPAYMLPGAYVFLETLPLSPSGKLDRTSLPRPGVPLTQQTYAAPRTHEEERIASIWQEILKVNSIGIHDNFFDLGGHSLLATQVVSRLRDAFDLEVPLAGLFDNPTVAGLATLMGAVNLGADESDHDQGGARERGQI